MPLGRSSDRDIIRARRALFVATALSTLSARAELPKKPECKRDEPVSAEEEDVAKKIVEEGLQLSRQALHDEALLRFERAFELLAHPKIALLCAKESLATNAPNRAMIWLNAALECGLEDDARAEAEHLIETTKASSGEIELRVSTLDPGSETSVDGEDIDPNGKTVVEIAKLDGEIIDPSEKLYVTPGKHVLDVQDNFYRHVTVELEIAAGEQRVVEIDLQPALMPRVCLSPLPCLQPPPPPDPRERTRLMLDLGVLGLLDVDRDEFRNHGLGAAVGLGVSIPLSRRGLRAFVGLEASPSKLRSGLFLPLGGRLEAAAPIGRLSIGLGVASGWVVASGDESTDESRRPTSSVFVEPYFPVDVWISERVGIQFREGIVFSGEKSISDEAFRLGFFRLGIFFRYAFGESEDDYRAVTAVKMPSHGW